MTQAVIQTTVTGMQGRPIATTVPANNQAYTWSGSAWTPTGPYLPLGGGVLTGALRIQYAAPIQIFNDTGTSITAGGLWRESNSGGNLAFQSNTATAGDFSTSTMPLQLNQNGSVAVANNITVGGAATVASTVTAPGLLIPNGGLLSSPGANIVRITTNNNNQLQVAATGFAFTNNGGLTVFVCDNNGNVSISGTLTQGSDERTKSNIAAYAPGVSIVSQLLPKTFTYTEDTANTEHLGFMAQDVQPLLPMAVSGTQDTMFGLDTTPLVAIVVNAVKQLISRVQALESHDGITPTAAETA